MVGAIDRSHSTVLSYEPGANVKGHQVFSDLVNVVKFSHLGIAHDAYYIWGMHTIK